VWKIFGALSTPIWSPWPDQQPLIIDHSCLVISLTQSEIIWAPAAVINRLNY
jgi:hypothetical protein